MITDHKLVLELIIINFMLHITFVSIRYIKVINLYLLLVKIEIVA